MPTQEKYLTSHTPSLNMKNWQAALALVIATGLIILSYFAATETAHAQIVPAQNQLIIAPYGGPGYVVSTSTNGIRKLEATSTPTFATTYIGRIINLLTNGVVYVSGGNGTLNSVGTSTPTVSAPITYSGTLGQFIGGISGAFGCTNASSGVTGCLTGTDWNTFNNKQAAGNYITDLTGDVTASGPGSVAATLATVNANTGSWGSATQVGTFTVNGKGLITAAGNTTVTPAVGSITGLGTGVATALGINVGTAGSFVVNGGALGTPSSGTLTNATGLPIVGGTTGTLSIARGGTGTTTTQAGRIYYGGGDGLTFQSTATTTVDCTGSITCSQFVTIGSTPISISGSGGGLTSYDAFTHPVTGYSATTSGMGVGTSTNFAFFGINPLAGIASRAFVVGSSTGTSFVIDNSGNVGIGTSTPLFRMDLSGDTSANAAYYATRYSADTLPAGFVARKSRGTILSPSAVVAGDALATFTGRGYGATIFSGSVGAMDIYAEENFTDTANGTRLSWDTTNLGASTRTEKMRLTPSGDLGIGTTTPKWKLTVSSSTAPQITLTDASITGAPFNLRTNGSYFTIGTSSPTTFATSTQFAFQLDGSTGSTTLQKLSVVGAATSTIVRGLTIQSLAATRAVFSAADSGLVTSAASASLLNSLTDETGSGVVVFGTSPTFTTSIAAVPLISGGAAVGSTLAIQGTSAASPTVATLTLRAASTISPSMTFTTRGIGAGTTTPAYLLNLASSTAPQLALSDGSITAAPWTFRSGNGNFYLATGSPTTFATTSNATLNNPFTIIAGGISGLFGFASSTPWANVGITSTAGIPALAIGSTTQTSFLIDSLGRTSIGSSSPWARFTMDKFLGVASSSITVAQYNPATSTSQSVDCRDSNTIFVSLGTGATTITLAPMVGGQSCVVALQNPNATAGAVTWSTTASQKLFWPSAGAVPTQTTTANKVDLWSFKAIAYPTSATSTPQTIIMGAQTPNFGP